jgi:hypothetical protein
MLNRTIFTLFILLFTASANTCQKSKNAMDALFDTVWKHSYEDNEGDVWVYRPENYDFPPSRGRAGFQLFADGRFVELAIAPTDGIEARQGTWTKGSSETQLQIRFANSPEHNFEMEVLEVQKNILKIKRK